MGKRIVSPRSHEDAPRRVYLANFLSCVSPFFFFSPFFFKRSVWTAPCVDADPVSCARARIALAGEQETRVVP